MWRSKLVDGTRSNDLQKNSRVGATLALPVNRHNSIKLHASSGVSTRTGSDFDSGGVACSADEVEGCDGKGLICTAVANKKRRRPYST
ncbi:MAG: hypothetical protein ABW034_01570 [Steroidobacteraceae bacterium]